MKERKHPYSIREWAFDLSAEELDKRLLTPYGKNRSIVTGGRAISLDEIHRIRVYETERQIGSLDRIPWDLMNEVTDDVITDPPGWQSETDSSLNQLSRPEQGTREVFVVHGRNSAARDALFEFLRAIDLHPLEWAEAVEATGKASPYIGEILNAAFSRAHAVIVLLTPDDEARLKIALQDVADPPHETQLTGQARPNVLFEAGMAMAGDQDRTVLVELGNLRPFSDIGGRHVIRLDKTTQRRQEFAQRLRSAGCPVNLSGTDWHNAGDFETALATIDEDTYDLATLPKQENPNGNEIPVLSDESRQLLLEATKDDSGTILVVRTTAGTKIQANGKLFGETRNKRSEAKWLKAISDLQVLEFVEDRSGRGQGFEVTHSGFEIADKLAAPT